MSRVLVTGGPGYLGTQLIAALLRDGREVRATVRSLESEGDVRAAVRRGAADDSALELVAAELTADEGWAAAATGCEEVHRTASLMIQTDDHDEVIIPAREGTLRALPGRAGRARSAGRADLVVRGRRLLTQARCRVHRGRLDRSRHGRAAGLPAVQDDRRAGRVGLHRT
jgi:uncharacterized protein YbjT (DUF2867 family)